MNDAKPLKKKLRIYIGDVVDKWKKFEPQSDNGFRVLLYHSITDKLVNDEWEENTVPKGLFDRQMKYLADRKYNVINCKTAIRYLIENKEIPAKTVVIVFDDGYRDNYTNVLPILKKYSFCATIFLVVDFLRDYSDNVQYLSCQEITNIKKSELIDFGCHGLTHKALSMIDGKKLDEEIRDAKQKLEYVTQSEIDLFAYPFGHSKSYSKKVIERIKSAGFIGSFTTIPGLNNFKKKCFLLRRNRISWIDELDQFEKHLSGSYDWCSLFEFLRFKKYR